MLLIPDDSIEELLATQQDPQELGENPSLLRDHEARKEKAYEIYG